MDYRVVMPAVLVVLVGAGVFVSGALDRSQDQEDSYEDLRSEARSSSYGISYDVSFARRVHGAAIKYDRVDIYSSEGLQRQEVSWSSSFTEGSTSQVGFYRGNNSVICNNESRAINRSRCKVTHSDLSFLHDIGKRADRLGLNTSYEGSYEVQDRECGRFSFLVSSNSTPASGRVEGPARYDVCLDKEKGYVAAISVTGNLTPLSGGEPVPTTLVNMEAEDVDTGFSGSVRPPFSFEASADCFWVDPYIKVMSFEDLEQVKIQVNGENYTHNLKEKFEVSEFDLPENQLDLDEENGLTVYAEDGKTSASCLYSKFEE